MKYDYLIAGAGLFGSVFAYEASKRGKKCLVVDRRNHIGGNIYCEQKDGINIHKYGAHIFHTSNKKVWEYILTDLQSLTTTLTAQLPTTKAKYITCLLI